MSYITTKNAYITVAGNQIAYREVGKGGVAPALGYADPLGGDLG